MEKAREFLEKLVTSKESDQVSQLTFLPHKPIDESSFYEYFVLRGVRVDRLQPGFFTCSFKVPSRLIDRNGNLSAGAIATLVDEIGAAAIRDEGAMGVSVDMSISYVSAAKLNDDLEITSRCLRKEGRYAGAIVLIRNKITGEVVAEGRNSIFTVPTSKM